MESAKGKDAPGGKYALILQYDGALFAGYQTQNGPRSVQSELEKSLRVILRQEIKTHCAGRTDAGVHALGQVVSFALQDPPPARTLLHSLNALLPDDMAAAALTPVPEDFHARFSCLAREYEYRIWNAPYPPVFERGRCLWIRQPLEMEALEKISRAIPGERDFASFTRAEYRDESTIRYVDRAGWSMEGDSFEQGRTLRFRIRGNAFLHNMIRILVGTSLDIVRGKIRRSMAEILEAKDRLAAGHTARAAGLYFIGAYYPPFPFAAPLLEIRDYPSFRRDRPAEPF